MPRHPRQFEIGGVYHIVNRGVEKRKIFLKNQDYSRFILGLEFFNRKNANNLWELITKAGPGPAFERIEREREKKSENIVELLAFALMPNHYHLIIREIVQGGIPLFMTKMGGYSTYFNKQNKRVGPLFQSRYKAVRVTDNIQLGNVFVYVHTNPVELKEPKWKDLRVKNAADAIRWLESYRWSSYHDYIGKSTFPKATQRSFFSDFYGSEKVCRQVIEDRIQFKAENAKLGSEIIE